MKNELARIAFMTATALSGCAADSPGSEPIEPPPIDDIFLDLNGDGQAGDPFQVAIGPQGRPVFETRYLFDDTRLRELCLRPDADSFDDYEEVDPVSGEVFVARGTTPISTECPGDGIVTGPQHEELLPSSWCRIEGCGSPVEGNESGEY
jgi:hypothetical protein